MNERDAFIDFAGQMLKLNYAQQFQDVFALWQSGLSRTGYFVEFGALNGIDYSNTYLMELLGWNGVVSEPHPGYKTRILESRKCNITTDCIWTEDNGTVEFQTVIGRPALSGIAGIDYDDIAGRAGRREQTQRHQVNTIRLETLLAQLGAPTQPDFLSIDTEGSELAILSDFDFSAFQFGVVTVEHGFSSQRGPLSELFAANGYVNKWPDISEHDDWYVHESYLPRGEGSASTYQAALQSLTNGLPESNHFADRERRFQAL